MFDLMGNCASMNLRYIHQVTMPAKMKVAKKKTAKKTKRKSNLPIRKRQNQRKGFRERGSGLDYD